MLLIIHLVFCVFSLSSFVFCEEPVSKAIVLPYERAKTIRGGGVGEEPSSRKACMTAGCHPVGTRCSGIEELGRKYVTASSHHCPLPNGGYGTSLFCCEKGSREALNILTLRARPNQYPHHVYLGIKVLDEETGKTRYLHCGGTIISRWWIVTASHCIFSPVTEEGKKPPLTVMIVAIVGQNHIQVAERPNRYEVDLENSVHHPDFAYNPLRNDISLLRLKEPLSFNGFVRPLAIANSSFVEQGIAEIIGYGKTDVTRSLSVLLSDTATIMDNEECSLLTRSAKPRTVMCIGGENEPVPNQGDSGGGAICRDLNNDPVLCGITSNINVHVICESGKRKRLNIKEGEALPAGCGYPPAIYTRVSQYYDWIVQHIF